MRFAGFHKQLRPAGHFRALRRLDLMIDIGCEFLDIARQHRKIDDADGSEFMLALDGSKSVRKADDALFQTTMQRTQVLAVVGQSLQRFAQNAGNITDTVKIALKMGRRRFRPVAAGG